MMRLFGNRHRAYEELVSARLDGQLDEAGEASLEKHLATCETCATDIREQGALRDLLRAQPLANVPRSFALPYAPMQVADREPGLGDRAGSLLRGMQIATATAAVVLVALIGVSIANPGAPDTPQSLVTAFESDLGQTDVSASPESSLSRSAEPTLETVLGFSTAEGPESATGITADPETLGPLVATDSPIDSGLMPDDAPTRIIDQEMAVEDEGAFNALASAVPADGNTPQVVAAPATSEVRSALEWAQLASGIVTALLAIAVVGLTWSSARRRA